VRAHEPQLCESADVSIVMAPKTAVADSAQAAEAAPVSRAGAESACGQSLHPEVSALTRRLRHRGPTLSSDERLRATSTLREGRIATQAAER
jgi:hypothetical protein